MLDEKIIADAEPRPKPYKLNDGKGMYLLIHSNGSRYWRLDYRQNGRRLTKALGVCPPVNLTQARTLRDNFKSELKHSSKVATGHERTLASFTDSQLITELKRRKLINF